MESGRTSKSRVSCSTALALFIAVALGTTSVVLNIIILTKANTINTNTNAIQTALHPVSTVNPSPVITTSTDEPSSKSHLHTDVVTMTPSPTPDTNNCQTMGPVSTSPGFKDAAGLLLSGLDESVDPCDDFYGFTCNKYLASINLGQGTSRKGTYDDSQAAVNMQIAGFLKEINDTDPNVSLTERITKRAFDSCVHGFSGLFQNLDDVKKEVNVLFGGAPFAGGVLSETVNLFGVAGYLEQNHALGTLLSSWVSVDYQDVQRNALYISQPDLDMPLDYFTLPQYIDQLVSEQDSVFQVMKDYSAAPGVQVTDAYLQDAAQKVVQFEVLIAMASWSDDLLRNYRQQYNPFNMTDLQKTYPNIDWYNYLHNMLDGIQANDAIDLDEVVLSTPSYFGWLDSIFEGKIVDQNTIANYMIVQMLMDTSEFWDSTMSRLARKKNYIPYAMRKGTGVSRVGKRHFRRFDQDPIEIGCLDALMAYMPHGPGYVYVKNVVNRDAVIADIRSQTERVISNFQNMMRTLPWMSPNSLEMALNKSNSLYQNYGYPETFFGDFKKDFAQIDKYHSDYADILNFEKTDVYDIMRVLKRGLYVREAFRLLTKEGNSYWDGDLRKNFLQSSAMVNAWYQPERNSISFPFAIFNPPYYNLDFPQAYNYAGQGGTGGHELTHGFDDEGVQFDWDGSMTDCVANPYKCGWMDASSSDGFTDMAQCVVSQYNSQCCPLKTGNVHCANGATTQGENIADLGGQQAAYFAYREWVQAQGKEEDRIPGMAQYTPNQVFWITYGYSWCMKQTDANMVRQLLTNPHAPAQCRTNNVMQDIPQFGRDFNCKVGSPMYPTSDQRCKVWVGY